MIKSIGNANKPAAAGGTPSPSPVAGNSLFQAEVIAVKKSTGAATRIRIESGVAGPSPLAGAGVIQPGSASGDDK